VAHRAGVAFAKLIFFPARMERYRVQHPGALIWGDLPAAKASRMRWLWSVGLPLRLVTRMGLSVGVAMRASRALIGFRSAAPPPVRLSFRGYSSLPRACVARLYV
jgi:hypothetical protein